MKKLYQSGRTMVEMLGVLAIVGVLSIGGIAGYSLAMTKYKTNNLINELNLRATIVSQQRLMGKEASLSEFTQPTNYPITLQVFTPNPSKYFGLQATNIEKKVCENIVADTPPAISGIYQNSARLTKISNCLDKTNLLFVFSNGLSTNDKLADDDAYACMETCAEGSVNPECTSSEKQKDTGKTACNMICAVCLNDTCPVGTFKSCGPGENALPAGKTEYGTQCYTCVFVGSGGSHDGGGN